MKGKELARESRRRARILKHYVAIERPTAADDEDAAAKLGLSVDSMIRLATVWRRNRNEALLVGRAAALARGSAADRKDVMAEAIDLDLVRPDRREETLRRIRIMQKHVAATERGEGDAATAAAEIGVSVDRFRALLRTWLLHARAEILPGATRENGSWRRQPDRARRLDLLRSTLAEADADQSLRAKYDVFLNICAREGLRPLSLPRFYAIAQEMRSKAANVAASE